MNKIEEIKNKYEKMNIKYNPSWLKPSYLKEEWDKKSLGYVGQLLNEIERLQLEIDEYKNTGCTPEQIEIMKDYVIETFPIYLKKIESFIAQIKHGLEFNFSMLLDFMNNIIGDAPDETESEN